MRIQPCSWRKKNERPTLRVEQMAAGRGVLSLWRRIVVILWSAFLVGAGMAPTLGWSQTIASGPLSPDDFQACIKYLAGKATTARQRLEREDFERITRTAQYQERARQGALAPAAEPTLWWDDLAATTDEARVAEGMEILTRESKTLNSIEDRWKVPKEIIVAIYGIETNYGSWVGSIPVLDATLTLACLRPCSISEKTCTARERAYAAVRMLRDKNVDADAFKGSWAGAFGRTQFVPDTYEEIAVDYDGDGRRDLIGSERDAWASAANHLVKRGGWIYAAPVFIEVSVPVQKQHTFFSEGRSIRLTGEKQRLSNWARKGWRVVRAQDHQAPDPRARAALNGDPFVYPFLPVGLPGPAFLVTQNFDTLLRYNFSERYVMQVALLAQKLKGQGEFVTPWPTDDVGLSREELVTLQKLLISRGYDIGVADGIAGKRTRDAIAAERIKKGMLPDRRVGRLTMPQLMQP